MGFLKKLGSVVLKITQIATGIGPILGSQVPSATKVIDTLEDIAQAVQMAEVMGQALTTPLPGAEKLKAATPLVAQLILKSTLLAGRKIADPVKFQAGCVQMASGMADVLNSLKDNDVEGENKA